MTGKMLDGSCATHSLVSEYVRIQPHGTFCPLVSKRVTIRSWCKVCGKLFSETDHESYQRHYERYRQLHQVRR